MTDEDNSSAEVIMLANVCDWLKEILIVLKSVDDKLEDLKYIAGASKIGS